MRRRQKEESSSKEKGKEKLRLAYSYLLVGNQEAVGVFVFTGDIIVRDQLHQFADKPDDFLVPGHVGHGQIACGTCSTVGDTLGKHHSNSGVNTDSPEVHRKTFRDRRVSWGHLTQPHPACSEVKRARETLKLA